MQIEPRANPILSLTKIELLERIQTEWDALEKVIQSLGPAAVLARDPGGWSIKDHLAHIGTWERFLSRHFFHKIPAHQALGMDEAAWRQGNEDIWNAWIQKQNQDSPYPQVLSQFRQAHDQVLADLQSLTEEDLNEPQPDLDPGENQLIFAVVWNTYEHYREHRLTIERVLHH